MEKRIKLDWSLSTAHEREAFVEKYINQEQFKIRPLTQTELTHISDYLLFGKDEDGKNGVQKKLYDIDSKSPWGKKKDISLDKILEEQPNFTPRAPRFKRREVFDREQARAHATPLQLQAYEDLWTLIDKLDWEIGFWELENGRRTKPIRSALDSLFTQEEKQHMEEQARAWSQALYFRKKRLLVELRKEQYGLRDAFQGEPLSAQTLLPQNTKEPDWDIAPLGERNNNSPLFLPFRNWGEHDWTPKERKLASACTTQNVFDFGNEEHLRALIKLGKDLGELESLGETLEFYIEQANLSFVQEEVLRARLREEKNEDVAKRLNKLLGKSYSSNYVSTILNKGAIPKLAETARLHEKLARAVAEKGNGAFKVCRCCGKRLLATDDFFLKRTNSSDGLGNRCKDCEKKKRKERKNGI
jgi:hypothetical protein